MTNLEEARRQVDEITQRIQGLSAAYQETVNFHRVLTSSMSLVRRVSGSENLTDYVSYMQRATMITYGFIHAANLAMTATGPIGWIMAGVSALTAVAVTADLLASYEVSSH